MKKHVQRLEWQIESVEYDSCLHQCLPNSGKDTQYMQPGESESCVSGYPCYRKAGILYRC